LDPTQLLYRLCCIFTEFVPGMDDSMGATVVHAQLLPLLALLYQAVPQPSASHATHQQQTATKDRGVTWPHTVRRQHATDTHCPPGANVNLLNRLSTAILQSPNTLRGFFVEASEQATPGLAERVLRRVQQRLQQVGSQAARECCVAIDVAVEVSHKRVGPLMEFGSTGEPLEKLLKEQHQVWQESWAGQYRPKEEAVHARLLDEYVRAAAQRAAHQQPSLADSLQAVYAGLAANASQARF
jgi:hypothetical protein